MINILKFREYCLELAAKVNSKSDTKIDHVRLAISEAHMTKEIADARGVILCAVYPDSTGTGATDSLSEREQTFFFVVEKVAQGKDSHEQQMLRYARLQQVALALRDAILDSHSDCMQLSPLNDYKIEWEWQIFGGCNGLSIGVKFNNYD